MKFAVFRPSLTRSLTRLARRGCGTFAPAGSSTAAIHGDALHEAAAGWAFSTKRDVSPPLSLSTTFTCADEGHVYSRASSPTRDRAEALLSSIEGTPDRAAHSVLYASGQAAAFAALSRLLPRRVAISGGYHGTHLVLQQLQVLSLTTMVLCHCHCHCIVGWALAGSRILLVVASWAGTWANGHLGT